jgi:alkanesulfonate monooxygenase SsuD/methylene tetrahydromethanopterin reductase-like flavin-dependent oxidoreductase (luciferase family)
MTKLYAARASHEGHRFTKVFHLHISVSRDGNAARQYCRRMATNGLIQGHILRQRLLQLPVPTETLMAIQNADRQGKNVEEMDALISDQVIDASGIVIAGAPAECIKQLDELLRAAKPCRFDMVDIASPLGPNWDEAIDLICQEIIPELERRSDAYLER